MKLSAREATRFCANPDRTRSGVLIFGSDAVQVAERRRAVVSAILGGGEDADLRLTQISGGDLRRDATLLLDAMKSQGFFSGPQVVLVEDATDSLSKLFEQVLPEAHPDDAFLVVTAGALLSRSKLRKAFEAAGNAVAAPCYGNVPDRGEIQDRLRAAGLSSVSDEALRDLEALSRELDSGAFRDLIERLALYQLGESNPVQPDDVAAIAPGVSDAAIDRIINAVAEGRVADIGPLMGRLKAQGQAPTTLVISASRAFRQIHTINARAKGGNAEAVISGLRPPVFGPRRDALMRQCRIWRAQSVESALHLLLETDNGLRGGASAAGYALLERAFLKIALTARKLSNG